MLFNAKALSVIQSVTLHNLAHYWKSNLQCYLQGSLCYGSDFGSLQDMASISNFFVFIVILEKKNKDPKITEALSVLHLSPEYQNMHWMDISTSF